ncbi:MAG: hypothetical protein RLY43_2500 [Bacteroidota bacterium]|jgi:tetratricopeptide (TPR) repeat protein
MICKITGFKLLVLSILFCQVVFYQSIKTDSIIEQRISELTKTLAKCVKCDEIYAERAQAKLEVLDYLGAIEDCSQAIKINLSNADAYLYRGFAKLRLGKYQESIIDLNTSIKLDKTNLLAYLYRGLVKVQLESYQEAINDLNIYIKSNPTYSEAYFLRGKSSYNLEKHHESMVDFNKAIELSPNIGEYYMLRATLKLKLSDCRGAILDYDKCIELNSEEKGVAFFARGWSKSILKNYNESIIDYNNAINIMPNNGEIYFERGRVKIELNQIENACLDFSRAGELGEIRAYELIKKYCI